METKQMPTPQDWEQVTHAHAHYTSEVAHGYEYQYNDVNSNVRAIYSPFSLTLEIWRDGTLYINKKAKGKNVDWANKKLCKFLKIMGKDFENLTYFKPKPVTSKIEVCNVDYFQFHAKMIDSCRVDLDAYKTGAFDTLIASEVINLDTLKGTLPDRFDYFVRKTLTKQGYCPDDFVLQKDGTYQYPIVQEEDMPKEADWFYTYLGKANDARYFCKFGEYTAEIMTESFCFTVYYGDRWVWKKRTEPEQHNAKWGNEMFCKYLKEAKGNMEHVTVFDEINEAHQNVVDNPEAAAERVREQVQEKKELEPSITLLAQIQMLTLTVSFGEHLTVPIVDFFHSMYDAVYIGNGTRGTVQYLTLDGSTGFVGNVQTVEYYSDGSFKIV